MHRCEAMSAILQSSPEPSPPRPFSSFYAPAGVLPTFVELPAWDFTSPRAALNLLTQEQI